MAEFRMSRRRDLQRKNGEMIFWLIRDISQRKFIEDRLRLSERLATLGTFASNVAHELNNPLASLLLTARHALRSLNREDVISSCLHDIIADSERCAEIIKKLRIFAKKQYSQKIVVDLNNLMSHIETILQAVAVETGIALSYQLSRDELLVSCNPTGLEQAITALIASVLHNSDRNSRIVVSTFSQNDKTRILIDDQMSGNGGGTTELQSGAQIPFSPAEVTSSGMGLITAYGIIHEHQGDLLTEARPGGRSATCIQFPKAEKPDPGALEEITKT
jgi:signal transduction histidine kinase